MPLHTQSHFEIKFEMRVISNRALRALQRKTARRGDCSAGLAPDNRKELIR
jgi:hypothetical protein